MLRSASLGVGMLSLLVPVALAADPITVDYSFGCPKIVPITVLGQTYDRVVLPGSPSGGLTAGQPALPAHGATILLPYGTELTGVEVTAGERVALGSGFLVEPVARPVPLSVDPSQIPPPQPDPAIYQSGQPFPGVRFMQISTQLFRGFQMVILRLQPVEYVPATGELSYFPHLTVTVQTTDSGRVSELYRGFPEDRARARQKIDNPAELATYPAGSRGERSYRLMILTTSDLVSAFTPLVSYHNNHGMPTVIHTTDETGTNPDDIRAYMQAHYVSDGIDFLLVGRDDDVIPAKNLYVDGINDMPGDLYFGCLDGTWNSDGDQYWGEPTDGPGGQDVDLVAEVYVGRAAVDSAAEATRFVTKTIWYLSDQHTHPERVLLVGEYLGFGGVADYASSYLNELIDGSDAHGYTTVGFPSDLLQIDTLYDAPGYDWPPSELVTRINNSVHIINHLGHGNVDYAMKLYNPDLSQLTNDDLCFVYSQTCLAGHFDNYDCWAETAHIKLDHACFGVVMNAREGYGAWESTDGPSQRYNREFWDAVYNPDESINELGAVNADSKEDNLWRINEEIMRWCYYEINLFGDPTIPVPGACSDAGTLELGGATIGCEGSLGAELSDCGLNVNDGGIDLAYVQATSDSDLIGVSVVMVETNLKSARFVGTISVSTTSTPGKVLVAPGDTVTLTYLDADDGSGQPATVTATAQVDCTPPTINYVNVADLQPRSATIAFVCDEPALGTIHYGLACDALVWSATGNGYALNPSVDLTALTDNTTYYYTVDATDAAGNTGSDATCRSFTTPDVPDFYTELFSGNNDLDNRSLTFVPNGSSDFYWACIQPITELPTDPAEGTALVLSNNNYATVNLAAGALVALYGASYNKFYVGSNGYITFNTGDSSASPTLAAHFNRPRISGLFADLYPTTGQVTWKQLADRAVVTWLNVSENGAGNQNTFQIEMFFDGKVTISYLTMAATSGLSGLSAGGGIPADFYMSDLTTLGACQTFPPTAEDSAENVSESTPADIVLQAHDDGLPNPPCALTYTVLTLPAHGNLVDPASGPITSVPYTLLNHGNIVTYHPITHYVGADNLSFKANDGGTPPDGGDSNVGHVAVAVVGVPEVVWAFPLDTNPGWSTTGAWAFGQPIGSGSHNKDPGSGHTGTNVYGYNLAGDYANNLSPKYLTTPGLDCSTLTQVELRFWRWLAVESYDHAGIEVSNDGSTWTPVWSNTTTISETGWTQRVYSLATTADHHSTVYVRWVMGPTDGGVTYPGWNLDDIEIWALVPAPDVMGDMNCDLVVDFFDINPFVLALTNPAGYAATYPQCNILHGDINGDGNVEFGDINPFITLLTGN
jgi:hypothetical protein